ncbi:hypothetical protein ACH5RR_004076 [Cinchona calisaya]|uniref:Dolichyl-diphosphooligosaccharide-protein glycosyltransferase subunit OST5 n=1 Tax=Cinchona calisaya TaxID=153742 RepID=A0ABD3AWI3_9GENT
MLFYLCTLQYEVEIEIWFNGLLLSNSLKSSTPSNELVLYSSLTAFAWLVAEISIGLLRMKSNCITDIIFRPFYKLFTGFGFPIAHLPKLGLAEVSMGPNYEATSSKKNRSLAKELTTGAVASVFLGFGSLFLLLASGVYV